MALREAAPGGLGIPAVRHPFTEEGSHTGTKHDPLVSLCGCVSKRPATFRLRCRGCSERGISLDQPVSRRVSAPADREGKDEGVAEIAKRRRIAGTQT